MPNVIDDILLKEGPPTDDPDDKGGRTAFGISEKSNPAAWADGKVTEDEARAIYEAKYVKGPGFDKVPDLRLREQLVDYGVTSGPYIAIQRLQKVLGVTQDYKLGPKTLGAIANAPKVNNDLMVERIQMICKIVQKDPTQLKYLSGWVNRALEFLV